MWNALEGVAWKKGKKEKKKRKKRRVRVWRRKNEGKKIVITINFKG